MLRPSPALSCLPLCGPSQPQPPPLLGRVDVVICLSTTVRNDTLQEAKEHRVSLKCRKQLRVEELEMVMPPPEPRSQKPRGRGEEVGEGRGLTERF